MNESKRMRGIEIHMRSAVQEDFKFTVATIDNREPLYKIVKFHSVRQLSLTGCIFEIELFKDDRTAAENTFSFCCAHGQVQAGRIPQPPTPYDDLLIAQMPAANRFREQMPHRWPLLDQGNGPYCKLRDVLNGLW